MTFIILYIRLKQLQREANALGLYTLWLIGIIFLLILYCYRLFENEQNAIYLSVFIVLVCAWLQFSRKDIQFIYKHIEKPHLQIFSEYVALTFPFSIPGIFSKNWFFYPLVIFALFCLPFFHFSFSKKTILKNLSAIIPASNFEWISGYRKYFLFLSILYLFAVIFCWFRVFPLIFLYFSNFIIASFYVECESIQVLREGNKLPRRYLTDKLTILTKYAIILNVPILIVNTFFNTEFLLINLLFILTQIAFLCFAICLKYAVYTPNTNQPGNNVLLTILALCSALPYLLPVPAILTIIYFYKAERNLKQYLND